MVPNSDGICLPWHVALTNDDKEANCELVKQPVTIRFLYTPEKTAECLDECTRDAGSAQAAAVAAPTARHGKSRKRCNSSEIPPAPGQAGTLVAFLKTNRAARAAIAEAVAEVAEQEAPEEASEAADQSAIEAKEIVPAQPEAAQLAPATAATEMTVKVDTWKLVAIPGTPGGILCRKASEDDPKNFSKLVPRLQQTLSKQLVTAKVCQAQPAVAALQTEGSRKRGGKDTSGQPSKYFKHIHG